MKEKCKKGLITFGILHPTDEIRFGECGNALVHCPAATKGRYLDDEGGRNYFMVSAACLYLSSGLN